MSTIINAINNALHPVKLGSVGPIFCSTTDLANIATVGKLIIPAPGVGFANIPYFMLAESSAGSAYGGTSSANIVNGSNTNVTAITLPLGLSGTSVINSVAPTVNGVTSTLYTNLNNQGIYLLASGITSGGSQTCQIWAKYYTMALV